VSAIFSPSVTPAVPPVPTTTGTGANASLPHWMSIGGPTALPARADAAVAFDPSLNRTVVFGGYFTGGACPISTDCAVNDTWEFDGVRWTNVTPLHPTPTTNPAARWGASMVYDPSTGGLLLFGGTTSAATGLNNPGLNDTWEFDSTGWTEVCRSGCPSPTARWDASFAFSSEINAPVLFGGETTNSGTTSYLSDTWTFTPSTNWTLLAPVVAPTARAGATAAWDGQLGGVVAFGGIPVNNQTWLYRNQSWHELSPAATSGSPSARAGVALAGDPLNGSVELFGGCDAFPCSTGGDSDTWVLAGTNWYNLTGRIGSAPPGRGQAGFVAAGPRGALLLVGGAGTGPRNDSWRVAHVELSVVSAEPAPVDVGRTTALSLLAVGGFGPLTIQWMDLPAGCGSANASALNCTPTAASSTEVFVRATDPAGEVVNSSPTVLVVDAGPSVTFSATPPAGVAPLEVGFAAVVQGGTGTISVAWEFGDGPSGTGADVTHAYARGGTYDATVWANDSEGESGSARSNVTVLATLTASAAFAPASIVLGNSSVLTIVVTGGSAPYVVRALGPTPECAANASAPPGAPTFSCTPTDVGTYPVSMRVTDASNQSVEVNATLTVTAPVGAGGGGGTGSNSGPFSPTQELWIVAAGIVTVLLVVALLLRRRGQTPVIPPVGPEYPVPPANLYVPPEDAHR
jgi:hypothetical protein